MAAPTASVFIENRGQFDPRVKFQLRSGAATLWLTRTGIVFDQLKTSNAAPKPRLARARLLQPGALTEPASGERLVFSENFLGCNAEPVIEASDRRPGIYNYLSGDEPSDWHTGVHTFAQVLYRNVWPGIDLRILSKAGGLEQEFVLHPGADPGRVRVAYEGIEGLSVETDGSLAVHTAFGPLRESKPAIYQEAGGQRREVHGSFVLQGDSRYAFAVDSYDSESALVIDPTILLYATYLGGNSEDVGNAIAVDGAGNAYVGGYSYSLNFPTLPGSLQTTEPAGGYSGFITKLGPTGTPVYSTYYQCQGCVNVNIHGIAVDAAGEAHVAGTAGAGSGSFVTKLNAAGNAVIYTTYPGDGTGQAIALDSAGNAYVTGGTVGGLTTTPNAYQMTLGGGEDAFLSVVSPQGSLLYSTYLGGSSDEAALAIAVDAFGAAYIGGIVYGPNPSFPATPGAYQTTFKSQHSCFNAGCYNGFVAKVNPNIAGSKGLIYASYLGGNSEDIVHGIAVDGSGSAYAAGVTNSGDFPLTPGSFNTTPGCGGGFLTKFNPGGSGLVYSTCIAQGDLWGIALDAQGEAHVVGGTGGLSAVPVTPDAFQSTSSTAQAYLVKLNAAGSGVIYGSYLGGTAIDEAFAVAVDQVGDAYVTGQTIGGFPVTPFAYQATWGGGVTCGSGGSACDDAFVAKFPIGAPGVLSVVGIMPTAGGNAGTVSPQITGTGFHAGATAQLNCGGSAVPGTNPTASAGGRLLNTTFNLVGVSPGVCDVVVTNAGGGSASLAGGFTVQQAGASNIQLSLTGFARSGFEFSPPTNAIYFMTIANTGNIDAPANVALQQVVSPFTFTSAVPPPFGDPSTLAADSVVVWPTPSLAPGQSQVFTSTAATSSPVGSSTYVPPGYSSCFNIPADIRCLAGNASLLCHPFLYEACQDCARDCASDPDKCTDSCLQMCEVAACNANKCDPLYCNKSVCAQTQGPAGIQSSNPQQQEGQSCSLRNVASSDPNSLVGYPGVGGQGWAAGSQALTYGISFANDPTASAPAQKIVVTQPLSPSLNPSSISLPGLTIPNGSNNIQVAVPASLFNPAVGLDEFTTTADLRPTQNLLVNVDAKLNPSARSLTWMLTSIDPNTGLPPLNPLIGFLPPGTNGNVAFAVSPAAGIATGTQISDQAFVVFDANAPINTPTWINTIDNSPPTSQVAALPASEGCPNFKVSWAGADIGSGLQGFNIYYSDDGGPFTSWLANTTATTGTFIGAVGHTYGFYSIAQDLVGNIQAAKTSADTSTQVTSAGSCSPPSLSAQVLNVAQSGTTVTATLQLTNTGLSAAQALNISQINLLTLNGSGAVTLTSPSVPLAVGTLAVGASTAVPLTFNVPSTVTRFSVTESGTIQGASGSGYSFSLAQTIIP